MLTFARPRFSSSVNVVVFIFVSLVVRLQHVVLGFVAPGFLFSFGGRGEMLRVGVARVPSRTEEGVLTFGSVAFISH